MAPAPRKSTGPSRTRKGAASAVSENTVETENIVELDPAATVEPAEEIVVMDPVAEPAREPITDAGADPLVPATDVDEAEEHVQPPARDLAVLSRLADTSGRSAVTPYPGGAAPSPVVIPPPLRSTRSWFREGDVTATARVLVDGWRVTVNGVPRFACKGDRVTAPADVIEAGIKRGTLLSDPPVAP